MDIERASILRVLSLPKVEALVELEQYIKADWKHPPTPMNTQIKFIYIRN
jgi:hypothetical protein